MGIEPRKRQNGVLRTSACVEGNTELDEKASPEQTPRGRRPRACAQAYWMGTERSGCLPSRRMVRAGRIGKSKDERR